MITETTLQAHVDDLFDKMFEEHYNEHTLTNIDGLDYITEENWDSPEVDDRMSAEWEQKYKRFFDNHFDSIIDDIPGQLKEFFHKNSNVSFKGYVFEDQFKRKFAKAIKGALDKHLPL